MLYLRLIPAGAGKTIRLRPMKRLSTAHPRRCGENLRDLVQERKHDGSSPQVRGKPFVLFRHAVNGGLIPAGAGKTTPGTTPRSQVLAHPRRCGENLHRRVEYLTVHGSSPQVRGKRVGKSLCEYDSRLIPAGAGKTRSPYGESSGSAAHPRRCGENVGPPIGYW